MSAGYLTASWGGEGREEGGEKTGDWVSSQLFFFFKLTDLLIALALNFRAKAFVIVFLSSHLKSGGEKPGKGGQCSY